LSREIDAMADEQPPFGEVPPPPPPPQPPGQYGAPPPPPPPGQWGAPPPAGQYGGPQPGGTPKNDGQALGALICSLVGLAFCGVILGIVGIVLGVTSRNRIRQSGGWLTGEGMASAGIYIGIADLVVWVLIIAVVASN
jgi:Domain of unknown function (DUF4190)